LTIDVRLQHILRREIQKAITDFTGKAGAGMIMDSRSGEILAAVSLPDFDPHSPNAKPDDPQMFNRVTLGVYELGSTFKVFTTAALLDRKKTAYVSDV
jgi:cell division protein FtsI (penicillin-binding protein 3)